MKTKKSLLALFTGCLTTTAGFFPACTILLIHHANKTGGFRGSTAIRDAVDEVWGLRRPDKRQLEQVGHNARLIAVEKSRAGRDGSRLLMKLEDDLTFSLADYVETDVESANPASVVDRVLQRLRAAYPRASSCDRPGS
jgi:replicative DNA helicase